jgi:peptidyl-prolyl cis-trans isomerase D
MMQQLREKTKIVMIIVALAFVGLMVFDWGMDISGRSVATQTGELGRVNGEPVSSAAYSAAYQQLYDQAQATSGGAQLNREQIRELEDRAFDQVVDELLLNQELRKRGIRVSDREIVQAAQWMPHPDLMQNELFLTNGEFDISKYQQFISGPTANEQLLLQLEDYYRATIPRSKLIRQVTAGLYISDAELWQMWRDQTESATVDYVQLNVSVLVPGDVQVSDGEVRDYYNEHEDEFTRPATARVTVASISKAPTTADSVAALTKAQELRAEIVGGANFAEVAARESDDAASRASGGSLGTFQRGDMVPEFENAAFSLPVGELSEPVQSPYGFHLIQVESRTEETVTARHILISYDPSDEALDALYARADSLEALTERAGIERAAGVVGAKLATGTVISTEQPYVPGVGSTLEGIEWIEAEQAAEDPLQVSPVFETTEAFYLLSVEEYTEPGQISLAQATPDIRRTLILEKKRDEAAKIGEQIIAEVRAGKTLEQAAQAHGLPVDSAGPFTRTGFNPYFGQANAVTGAAFGVPIGQVSDVLSIPGGLYIVRPKSRVAADRAEFDKQKEQLRQISLYQLQQEATSRWLESLRRNAEIIDRRRELTAQPLTPLS